MNQPTSLSFEFFPPKDGAGEARLWDTLAHLADIAPDFLSVTYGAGGSTRDRTLRITSEITARTGIPTVAHLTCVGATRAELESVLTQYKSAGIHRVLALRGDPPGGPRDLWVNTPDGFDHADQLVELAKRIGGFKIGVAAFPDGHPASNFDFDKDIKVLLRKEQLGARFATTQFFFEVSKWQELVERLQKNGSNLPVIAGLLPVTNLKQLSRMVELSGTKIPVEILNRFESVKNDPVSVKKIGIDIATQMGAQLLDLGAPGLHFYTMNTAESTIEIAKNLGLVKS